jgi:hypothetical protein
MSTLQARLNEIAAQEREWLAQGHPVAIVSNTVAWWNERGIFTAADLDAHFAGDPHASTADLAYFDQQEMWAGYDAWLDEQELLDMSPDRGLSDEEYETKRLEAIRLDEASFNPVFAEVKQARVYAHYQAGW